MIFDKKEIVDPAKTIDVDLPSKMVTWAFKQPKTDELKLFPHVCNQRWLGKKDYCYISGIPARTAQGGGGSFKDRKPIGEVDGCDAWMAEQTH